MTRCKQDIIYVIRSCRFYRVVFSVCVDSYITFNVKVWLINYHRVLMEIRTSWDRDRPSGNETFESLNAGLKVWCRFYFDRSWAVFQTLKLMIKVSLYTVVTLL